MTFNNTINYSVTGKGSEAVILLHGSMSTKNQWLPFERHFSSDYRLIAFDLIGYGDTPPPVVPESYSLKNESEIIDHIVSEVLEPNEPYHLVGHSYGGVVALYHAYHHQDRIRSLTGFEPMCFHLLEKSDPVLLDASLLIDSIQEDISDNRPLDGVKKFMDLWVAPGSTERMTDNEKVIMADYIKKMVIDYRSASEEPLHTSHYNTLKFPVCLIAGRQSPDYSMAITALLNQTIKQAEMYWVEGGHFSPVTHRNEVNEIIDRFIKSVQMNEKLAS